MVFPLVSISGWKKGTFVFRLRKNKSACEFFDKVSTAILKELNRGHAVGPFSSPPLTNFHVSLLGAVPKNDGLMRVVLDLSSPKGFSVNDGILKDPYSVTYTASDDSVNLVRKQGKGCYLAKLDIKHAFRLCPVRPEEWHLLGYKWVFISIHIQQLCIYSAVDIGIRTSVTKSTALFR